MIKRVLDSHLVNPIIFTTAAQEVSSEPMPNTLKPTSWVWLTSSRMQYMFLCCVLLNKVSHRLLSCTVLIIPSLTCLGSQHPVDPHRSIECINRTKYTVGTVGISDIFCSVPGAAPCPTAQRGIVLVWFLHSPPQLDEGSGACLVLPQRATALCQPFPGGAGLCRATTQKFCML